MALINACEIARDSQIDISTEIRVIDESTAVIYGYASESIQSLINVDTKVIAFIEVGNSQSSVTIATFKGGQKVKAEIKHVECDRNLGGRDLDTILMKFGIEEFQKEEGF